MATNVKEVMQRLANPGEQVLLVVVGRSVQAKAATAALVALVSPLAMRGVECLVAITPNTIMSVTWTAASWLIKPRKAWIKSIADIASYDYTTKKSSGRLELLFRDGKKARFVLEDRETGDQLVGHLEQARQRLGFHAGPGAPAQAPQAPPPPVAPQAPPPPPQPAPPSPGFGAPLPSQAAPPPAPAAGASLFCTSCGQAADPDSRFCEHCGAPIEQPEPAACPGCGQPKRPGAKFCRGCGSRF